MLLHVLVEIVQVGEYLGAKCTREELRRTVFGMMAFDVQLDVRQTRKALLAAEWAVEAFAA